MKRIVILGAGESGTGAAILAQKQGFEVFLSDKGKIKDKYKTELLKYNISFEEEKHSEDLILNANEVIKSPGIPDKAELIKKLKENKISIISEIEFAARYTNATLVGVTGTNGKTTTTSLVYHIFNKAGLKVAMGGNIGKSFARLVAENDFEYYVLELSSFQLDGMFKTRINIAILVNITPDHLDRYNYELQNYVDSKFRITQNQTADDAFIYCADDAITMEEVNKRDFAAKLYPFSIKKPIEQGAYLNENQLIININPKNPFTMSMENLALQGKHNLYNSMAAGIAARIIDLRKEIVRESLSDFENIEHRLETVTKVHGIEFINDSKATNVNSTWYALESMTQPTIWIVGGQDKGNDYEDLKPLVKEKVKAIVCLGVDNSKIIAEFKDIVPVIVETKSAEDAVKQAYRLGKKDDVVLLSPACASFDLFENYEERGRQFKAAVRSL
jgi:UDP-N-acetylmuramoylalanine--D-glutamate ligase